MACITWRLPSGETYDVAENQAHTPAPGAYNTGIVKWNCEGTPADEVEAMLEKEGLKIGDTIAYAAKFLGIKQCAPCKARQVILNNMKKLGLKETLRQIKDTL